MSELINKPIEGTLVTTEKPAYLAERKQSTNLQQMAQQIRPPRLKFIQALTSEPYKPPFKEGEAIITPNMIMAMDQQTPMSFTPLYYYVDHVAFNPNEMKGQVPFIREQSLDPNSLIAKKCQMFLDEPFPAPGSGTIRYRKVHIWISMIHGFPEIHDQPVTISFKSGSIMQNLMLAISKRQVTDMFACRFRGIVYHHQGKKNKWWSMAIDNDPEPFVDETTFFKYEKVANYIGDLVQRGMLDAAHDEDDEGASDDPSKEKKY